MKTLKTSSILLLFSLVLFSMSCSPRFSSKVDTGETYSSKIGHPSMLLTATSRLDRDQTSAIIAIAISESSLIFKKRDDSLATTVELDIEIIDPSNNDEQVFKEFSTLNFSRGEEEKYYEHSDYYEQKTVSLDPGKYEVTATIRDLNSGKESTVSEKLEIPNPSKTDLFISNIQLLVKEGQDATYQPVHGYHVQVQPDSIQFIYQITNGEDESVEVRTNLLRFEADTSIARQMSDRNYRPSSLPYRGIDFSDYEVEQTNRRIITNEGSVIVENRFHNLPKGNYRFEVMTRSEGRKEQYQARDFSVKSPNFPAIKTPRELARPMAYLMTGGEYQDFMQTKSEDSLKAKIDQYWLSHIKNAPKAKQILALYYERVEEANRQFSNFKEGWKTDPGMIYILFGPPRIVDYGFGTMTWIYTFDSGSRIPAIRFEDVRYGNRIFPFENYILRRDRSLHSLEYNQIQAWNDGSILFLSQ